MPKLQCTALILAAALVSGSAAHAADACRFAPLKIETADKAKYARYVGKGKFVDIELTNHTGKPTDTFSEPPLRVRSSRGGSACAIDAGNWVLKSFFLSADETYLMAYEFSGSEDELVVYDVAKCERKNAFKLAGAKWSVDGNAITIGAHCNDEARKDCVPKQVARLDEKCGPLDNKK